MTKATLRITREKEADEEEFYACLFASYFMYDKFVFTGSQAGVNIPIS